MGWLISLSGASIAAVVKWVLAALGVGAVTYTGVSALLQYVTDYAETLFGQLPATALQLAGMLGIDICITIVLSAYGINAAMMAVSRFRIR